MTKKQFLNPQLNINILIQMKLNNYKKQLKIMKIINLMNLMKMKLKLNLKIL